MLGNKEGLNSEVKFVVAATYEKFSKKWGLSVEKMLWIDIWAPSLSRFSINQINAVADYCIKEFRCPPVLTEYIELCTRLKNSKPLSEPTISKIERMAYLILANEEFQGASSSEISDACLISASIASLNSYAEIVPNFQIQNIKQELSGRLNMFFEQALIWKLDSEEGKGYWNGVFISPKLKN